MKIKTEVQRTSRTLELQESQYQEHTIPWISNSSDSRSSVASRFCLWSSELNLITTDFIIIKQFQQEIGANNDC